MIRGSAAVLLSIVMVCGIGCAMCCSPDMYAYPTYGGRVERSDPEYGRVGSIFSDPMAGSESTTIQDMVPEPAPGVERIVPQPSVQPENAQPKPANNNARRQRVPQGWR